MALDDLVRDMVALADDLTKELQGAIQIYPVISERLDGTPVHATSPIAPAPTAIVEYRQVLREGDGGRMQLTSAKLTFLTPIPAPAGSWAQRQVPIDTRDRLVLPDGTSNPILAVEGLADRATGEPYFPIVFLSAARQNQT